MMDNNIKNMHIDKSLFEFAHGDESIHDTKFDTKPVSYLRDAMRRFAKNKGSVVAAVIILILALFAIITPWVAEDAYTDSYGKGTDTTYLQYGYYLPKTKGFEGTGFWDGTKRSEINQATYRKYLAMEAETGRPVITKEYGTIIIDDVFNKGILYDVRVDSYASKGMFNVTLTKAQYDSIIKWQTENDKQVIYPQVDTTPRDKDNPLDQDRPVVMSTDASIWYSCDRKGVPEYAADGSLIPAYLTSTSNPNYYYNGRRIAGDDGSYIYAKATGAGETASFAVRVDSYNYFLYKYGEEPCFAFGTTAEGFDVLTRLANGARFSFLLAILVSAINLTIGAIYGAIEGYYGGLVDMTMERIVDILGGIPFMVVTVLFQMHLAQKVGVVGALIYAFILTGWIGMAGRVRMQFYRFKSQEYVLAARTLGASDKRIIWRHIFPNSLGTIITGTVLVIPGVIFSETSLSYLGIINLNSNTMSSIGSMLSSGQKYLKDFPHIILFPALFIALLEISFNLFGNGLRDAFNPQLRGSEG